MSDGGARIELRCCCSHGRWNPTCPVHPQTPADLLTAGRASGNDSDQEDRSQK